MYKNELILNNTQNNGVDAILQYTDQLSIDEKAELIERLLDEESGLMVVSATTDLPDYIIAQTNLLSMKGLAYVWKAIANRMLYEENTSIR